MNTDSEQGRRGRIVAILIVGIALSWVAISALGGMLGWTHRTLAFFDLAALAGFGMALWMIYGIWRLRQNNKGPESKD